jgi:hypothetical protein
MWFFLILIALVGTYLVLTWGFGLQLHVVPEEKRLVIYRLGRFQRVAGPGLVPTWGTDTIEREINARNEPHNLRVENVFMKGVSFGYTLNMWLRTDLAAAADGNRELLRELALFSDREREQQISVKLREALVRVAARIENSYQLKPDAKLFEKLLPILPGLPLCEELIEGLRKELKETLPTIGVMLSDNHPIAISALHLSPAVLNGFKQGHIATLLREQYPDLASERILRAVGTIEGIDLQEQRVILDGNGNLRASMDFREGEKGRLKTYVTPDEGNAAAAPKAAPTPVPVVAAEAEPLTHDDLQILKRVPPYRPVKSAVAS